MALSKSDSERMKGRVVDGQRLTDTYVSYCVLISPGRQLGSVGRCVHVPRPGDFASSFGHFV